MSLKNVRTLKNYVYMFSSGNHRFRTKLNFFVIFIYCVVRVLINKSIITNEIDVLTFMCFYKEIVLD